MIVITMDGPTVQTTKRNIICSQTVAIGSAQSSKCSSLGVAVKVAPVGQRDSSDQRLLKSPLTSNDFNQTTLS